MNVFGKGGIFNVTSRTAAGFNNSQVHIIEGEIEVKRFSEQGVDIYKFQIESFSQKQIEYRSQKFINNASLVFVGALINGVIKIKEVDYAGPNHFFADTTKALMGNTVAINQQQQQQHNYGGFMPPSNMSTQQQNFNGYQPPVNVAQPVANYQQPVAPQAQQTNYSQGYQPVNSPNQVQPNQAPVVKENVYSGFQPQNQGYQQQQQQNANVPNFAAPSNNGNATQQNAQQMQTPNGGVNYAELFEQQ